MTRNIRLVCALLALIVLLSACGATHKSSNASMLGETSGATQSVSVRLTDFAIAPAPINVQAGSVTFNATNAGQSVHNFEVKLTGNSKSVGGTKNLDPGQSASATLQLQKGTYIGYCSEPGHESLGMKVSIVVS